MARKAVLTILMLCIFGLFGFAQVVDLAVTKVEALGVEQKTARLVEDVFQSQLATQPLLRLVERKRLDALLQEQELQLSVITSAESAARADFLYPTYYLLSTAAGYSYWKSTDSSVIGYGIVPEIAYEGRRFISVMTCGSAHSGASICATSGPPPAACASPRSGGGGPSRQP